MLIVGERINSTRRAVARAIAGRDEAFMRGEAERQTEAGADFIDVNVAAAGGDEPAHMAWAVGVVQQGSDLPLCIDSPNPKALAAGLAACTRPALVNSISGEQARLEAVLPLVQEHQASVVALALDDTGMPETADDRLAVTQRLVEHLGAQGIAPDRIYVDPLVRAVSTEPNQGREVLAAIQRIRAELPGVHVICGLSNISFGLPARTLLNHTFLAMAVWAGLDAAILDPLDRDVMSALCAARALLGQDEFCIAYLQAHRGGELT